MSHGPSRELLAADVAVGLGVATPEGAAAALVRFWQQGGDLVDALTLDEESSRRVRAEVARLLGETADDAALALTRRGGVNRRLRQALTQQGAGAAVRPPLRTVDPARYTDFSAIGQGGMGAVYLALDTELGRDVAFKVIRPFGEAEPATPLEQTPPPDDAPGYKEVRSRFLQEAWVTGGLEHPGIVPVYEVGRTAAGLPYYTMRFVRGKRTLEDAISGATTQESRLALLEPFLKACDAVRFAHSRGVVHRDLKPSNIALGEYGEAVILDWGLAKLRAGPDLAEARWRDRIDALRVETDLRTLTSALGTPGYMAPEAALGRTGDVDERSDVYSLGAILYRMLTGRLPLEFTSYGEFARKLLDDAPRPPSEIDRAVPEGLSRIAMKALAAGKEERYADADELAAAIRGWQVESAVEREVAALEQEAEGAWGAAKALKGEALLGQLERVTSLCGRIEHLRPGRATAILEASRSARSLAIAEREQAARRRALRRAGAVGLAAALVVAVAVALLLDQRRRESDEARDRADRERERAEELARFMLFDLRDGLQPIGRLDLLGKVAVKAREYYESLPTSGATTEDLRRRGVALENVGDVLKARGDLEGALSCYRESLAITERLVGQDATNAAWQRDLSIALERVGGALETQGDLKGALSTHRRSLEIRRHLAGQDATNAEWQRDLSIGLERVARVKELSEDMDGALSGYRDSLGILRRLAAQDPSNAGYQRDISTNLVKVGGVLIACGDLEGATSSYTEALKIARQLVAQEPANAGWQRDLAVSAACVGDVCRGAGDREGALERYQESLAISMALAKGDVTNTVWQRDLLINVNRVGVMLEACGDAEGALRHYQESLAITRRLAAQDPTNQVWQHDVAIAAEAVGRALEAREDLDGALSCYAEALRIREVLAEKEVSKTSRQHDVVITIVKIGDVLEQRGDLDGALARYREALPIARSLAAQSKEGEPQREVAMILDNIGDVLEVGEDFEGAMSCYRKAQDILRALVAREATSERWRGDLAVHLHHAAGALEKLRRVPEAYDAAREAEALHEKLTGQEAMHGSFVQRRHRLGLVVGAEQPETSSDLLERAYGRYNAGTYLESARDFKAALEDEAIRTDLGRTSLYDAACSAALAATALKSEEQKTWKSQALEWLGEDLRRRGQLRARIERELAGEVAPDRRQQLERARAEIEAHIERARRSDTDLACIRGTPEFESLFR